jgi:SAM-dependent methyltransferase
MSAALQPTAADRARAYVANAVSISGTMARYALAREGRGVENGLRALRTLAREVAAAARPGARPEGASGSDKQCPICGWRGPRFGPAYYYDSYREDARCYVCGSTERCRMLELYIAEHLGGFFARPRRVLDIGPLRYSRGFFPDSIDYVSFDLVSDVAMVRGDLCHAPFPEASFDAWLCSHVLDQIPDDTQAMRELCRLLRPGGLGILDNAMSWDRKTEEYGEPRARDCGRRRRYGFDLVDRLSAVGFDVERVDSTLLFDEALRRHYGISPRVLLICRPGS